MRKRNDPAALEQVLQAGLPMVHEPEGNKGGWKEELGGRPLFLEIGMGKGGFLSALAAENPDAGFIGIEAAGQFLEKAIRNAGCLENVRMIFGNAEHLRDFFMPGEIDGIYLNFSDPWPKNRHKKRRLTHRGFLEVYQEILAPGGVLVFKTDNTGLFEFSLNEFLDSGWKVSDVSLDLYRCSGGNPEGNIPTEYEIKLRQTSTIKKLTASPPAAL